MDLAVKARGSHTGSLVLGPRWLFSCPRHFHISQEQDKSLGSPFSHRTASQKTTTHWDISTPKPSSGIRQL